MNFGGVRHHAGTRFRWFENTLDLNLHAKGEEVEADSLGALEQEELAHYCKLPQ